MEKEKNVEIAYQNKDIVMKTIGDHMRNKSLSIMGWDTDLVITDILPTNLPAIKVDELRLDDLFKVNDGGAVLVDYESSAREKNVLKYLNYIPRILETYPELFKDGKLRIFILYTADVKKADVKTDYDFGCIKLHIEAAFLSEVDSKQWTAECVKKISQQAVDEDTMMKLILLPLTYPSSKGKDQAAMECVKLAKRIEDQEQKNFVLAGILAFSDKVISKQLKKLIMEEISMVEIEKMIMEKGREEGREQGREQGEWIKLISLISKKQQKGVSAEHTAEMLEESTELVEKIYAALASHPGCEPHEIYNKLEGCN